MSPFVARTKQERQKLRAAPKTLRGEAVTLACGCIAQGQPPLSNPDRWWCCAAFQRAKRSLRA